MTQSTASEAPPRRSRLGTQAAAAGKFFSELYSRPQSALGTSIVLFFLLLAVIGPVVAPYEANDTSSPPFEPPSTAYPFGTDREGRDMFSRVILGTGSIFTVAGLGTLIAVVIGTGVGLFTGYQGGLVDEVITRTIDAFLAMPALLIALVMLGVLKNAMVEPGTFLAFLADNSVLIVISIVYVPLVARVVRSRTLEIKSREFVLAAQIRGESQFYIIFREILPSVVPALVVEASLRFSYAIFLVASLGFLGVGIRPPTPDWGFMVNQNRELYRLAPWALFYPAGAIALLVVGVNLMSDGVRRVLQRGD